LPSLLRQHGRLSGEQPEQLRAGSRNRSEERALALPRGTFDVPLVLPGETVDLLLRYSQHTGLFVYHCHNLAHEDDGMMRNLRIDP
jgi:FtsP/CotA-like multicopper oxidase with cupredoxin domain